MPEPTAVLLPASPPEGLVKRTHIIYLLHGFSAAMGLLGSAFIVTAFLSGWPSIIAVVLNYLQRSEVRNTYLDSHFSWQIRTFWFAVLWIVLAVALAVTVIGIPFAWMVAVMTGLWVIYRIIRGWLALTAGKSMPG